MRRLNFRLTLEPGLDGVVRLAQLHQYATDLVDGKRKLILVERDRRSVPLIVSGDQIDPEAIANIIQASCPSALPTGFCYAYGCSKLRPDEFGGGFVVIMEDDVVFQGTQEGLDTALRQIEDEDTRPMVLTISDKDHGLSYWNVKEGFGRLADATVFTPAQASTMEPIIADDEPEWATMPRWPQ